MSTEETATLGGGCFWCVEAVYQEMEGVLSVEFGYMGGSLANPTYQQVCGGATGHVEVVQVKFDPGVSSYRDILEVFFAIHDPTSVDRQGDDTGVQYRSVIFHHSDAQRETAERIVAELDAKKLWPVPIVTELRAAGAFYPAENYHRDYFRNHPSQPYCAFVVAPKLSKFRQKFAAKLRKEA